MLLCSGQTALLCHNTELPYVQFVHHHAFVICSRTVELLFLKHCLLLQDRLPLAVVGSNTIIEVNGKRVRGRQYPWGVAEGKAFLLSVAI